MTYCFINIFRRVIILLDITVLKHGSEVGFKIGNPENCESGKKPTVNGGVPSQLPAKPQYKPPQSPGSGTSTV